MRIGRDGTQLSSGFRIMLSNLVQHSQQARAQSHVCKLSSLKVQPWLNGTGVTGVQKVVAF